MPPNKERRYSYSSLNELKMGSIVNVYGVVKFHRDIRQTTNGQYHMLVTLTAPECEGHQLCCSLFQHDRDKLPPITGVGDVIRFHRLKIGNYDGKLQATSGTGFSWYARWLIVLLSIVTIGNPRVCRMGNLFIISFQK